MNALRYLKTWLAATVLLTPAPALADPSNAVFNAEGAWAIDVDHDVCVASRMLKDGATFLLRAKDGQITFGLFADNPVKVGKTGRLEADAYGFNFKPGFAESGKVFFFDGTFDARTVAALRRAGEVRLLIDGRVLEAMPFTDTGFEATLDGVIACSKGAGGWWGKGVGGGAGDTQQRLDRPIGEPVLSKQGVWEVTVSKNPGLCVAQASVDEHTQVQILAASGAVGVAIASDGDMVQGRRGRIETDDYSVAFTAGYAGPRYMRADDPFEKETVLALRRAKLLRISIDGQPLVDLDLKNSGFMEVLDSVAACSRGQGGWWGAGAKRP